MKDQLITFETAKLAKEKGFEIGLHKGYFEKKEDEWVVYETAIRLFNTQSDSFEAPTQSLLQKWLREKHKIHAFAHPLEDLNSFLSIVDVMTPSSFERLYISDNEYNNFENALERSLKEALKLIKDKK